MVTQEEIKLVQESWEKVKPISATAAELFYAKLFELDPEARALFTGNMESQGEKLMNMITVAVDSLNDLGSIIDALKASGRRHVDYGVKDSQYDTVGAAFLDTLDKGLGDDFTPEVKQAWTNVYGVLASTMIEAADEYRQWLASSSEPEEKKGLFGKLFG